MNGENTLGQTPKKRGNPATLSPAWKPGQSGNPAGRPKGARVRFSEAFIEALADDFEEHGATVIEAARIEDPVGYLKVCAALCPKDINIKADATEAFTRMWDMLNAKVIEHESGSDQGRLAPVTNKPGGVRN